MIPSPRQSVLFCGMGSHARAVPIFLRQFGLQTIYIIYSQTNTAEYEVKIHRLKTDIEAMKGLATVHFLQINERDLVTSFQQIASIYTTHVHDHIYTDLTAGHKIISYLLWYAHTYLSVYTDVMPIATYLWDTSDVPIVLPTTCPVLPDAARIAFLRSIKTYYATSPTRSVTPVTPSVDVPFKRHPITYSHVKLTAYLAQFYSRVQITRYRRDLIRDRFLTHDMQVTLDGEFLIAIAP